MNASRLFVISGCSGGGKSSLLAALAARGYRVFTEPGRQVVKEQQAIDGDALPWKNGLRFAELCVARAVQYYDAARGAAIGATAPVFFDRSVIDNISGVQRAGLPISGYFAEVLAHCRYARQVFLVPPWPEIYVRDAERQHSFEVAEAEFHGLEVAYAAHGYDVLIIPKQSIAARADFVIGVVNRV